MATQPKWKPMNASKLPHTMERANMEARLPNYHDAPELYFGEGSVGYGVGMGVPNDTGSSNLDNVPPEYLGDHMQFMHGMGLKSHSTLSPEYYRHPNVGMPGRPDEEVLEGERMQEQYDADYQSALDDTRPIPLYRAQQRGLDAPVPDKSSGLTADEIIRALEAFDSMPKRSVRKSAPPLSDSAIQQIMRAMSPSRPQGKRDAR